MVEKTMDKIVQIHLEQEMQKKQFVLQDLQEK